VLGIVDQSWLLIRMRRDAPRHNHQVRSHPQLSGLWLPLKSILSLLFPLYL
jgi:hypothetical protein